MIPYAFAQNQRNDAGLVAFTNHGTDSGETSETLHAASHGALPMVGQPTLPVFPTLAASTGGPGSQDWQQHAAVITPAMQVRRLTPLECERLQGFPDGWTALDGMSDSARYRMLGNAVCVNVVEWILKRIVNCR